MININCAHSCRHQSDGKCTLNTASYVSDITEYLSNNSSIDCPYFEGSCKSTPSTSHSYWKSNTIH